MRRAVVPAYVGVLSATIVVFVAAGPAFAGSSQYPPRAATCASAPSAGSAGLAVTVRGTNWSPGTSVTISFSQAGTTSGLGSAPVDGKGMFATTVTIPAGAQRGKASIVVDGVSINGGRTSCATNFEVVDPHHTVATLPKPGTPVTSAMLIAGLGVLIGATAIGRRRRRPGPWTWT